MATNIILEIESIAELDIVEDALRKYRKDPDLKATMPEDGEATLKTIQRRLDGAYKIYVVSLKAPR